MCAKIGPEYLRSREKRIIDNSFARLLFAPVARMEEATVKTLGIDPVFTQKRVGANGAFFEIYKLRTLVDEELAFSLASFLRRYGIDEALQYKNVLDGQMFVCGTRRALLPDHEDAILNSSNGKLVDTWLEEVLPLAPSIVSSHSLALHTLDEGAAILGSGACERKLEMDIEDIRSASFSRDISLFTRLAHVAATKKIIDPRSIEAADGLRNTPKEIPPALSAEGIST